MSVYSNASENPGELDEEQMSLKVESAERRPGAITRMKNENEIEILIPNLKDNLVQLRELLLKLGLKFEAYKEECNKQMITPIPEENLLKFRNWYCQHEQNVTQFYKHESNLLTIDNSKIQTHINQKSDPSHKCKRREESGK